VHQAAASAAAPLFLAGCVAAVLGVFVVTLRRCVLHLNVRG
jgi:hypothetical protein